MDKPAGERLAAARVSQRIINQQLKGEDIWTSGALSQIEGQQIASK
jgi:hypothetical protein